MKTTIFIFILLLIIAPIVLLDQVTKKEQIGTVTTYSLDSDYAMGVVLYESEKYNSDYEQARIDAIKRLKKSANRGFAPSQFYLGKIYLGDPLIFKQDEGIRLIKKAAYQNDEQAIQYLTENKIPYKSKPRINKYKKYMLPMLITHLLLSGAITFWLFKKGIMKRNKNKILIIWLLPFLGGVIGLLGLSKKQCW
ncbi:MAG: hypothetical protein WC044_05810 [Crocinitomicaceae bacterium]